MNNPAEIIEFLAIMCFVFASDYKRKGNSKISFFSYDWWIRLLVIILGIQLLKLT